MLRKSLWYSQRLSIQGYKLTKPRQVILDTLNKTKKHMGANKIYKAASNVYPGIGLATIYRNLELLVRIGMVWKFDVGDDWARYEIAQRLKGSHHHHLVCKDCNSIIDYFESIDDEKEFLKRREKNLEREYNFKIENHIIDFFGLCKKCKDKK